MNLVIVSKSPPGGRCTLYQAYAREIAALMGGEIETRFPEPGAAGPEPPALLIEEREVKPADGLILSPQEVHDAVLAERPAAVSGPELLSRLETVESDFLEGAMS